MLWRSKTQQFGSKYSKSSSSQRNLRKSVNKRSLRFENCATPTRSRSRCRLITSGNSKVASSTGRIHWISCILSPLRSLWTKSSKQSFKASIAIATDRQTSSRWTQEMSYEAIASCKYLRIGLSTSRSSQVVTVNSARPVTLESWTMAENITRLSIPWPLTRFEISMKRTSKGSLDSTSMRINRIKRSVPGILTWTQTLLELRLTWSTYSERKRMRSFKRGEINLSFVMLTGPFTIS